MLLCYVRLISVLFYRVRFLLNCVVGMVCFVSILLVVRLMWWMLDFFFCLVFLKSVLLCYMSFLVKVLVLWG